MIRLLLVWGVLLAAQGLSAQQIFWITGCSNKNFCLNQNSCTQGDVYLVEKAATNCPNPNISYSYKIDLNNDNVMDIQSFNDTVSASFGPGTHRIVWRANDNCGNLTQCTYLFVVKDCQPPSLLCINGLTQGLEAPTCTETFSASQFILMMSDNCTPKAELEIGMRRTGDGMGFPTDTMLTFVSCDQGSNPVEVWVRDENGLSNICNTQIIVQDSDNDCACNYDADLYFNGCARSGGNKRLSEFDLHLSLETLPGAGAPFSQTYRPVVEDSCFSLHISNIPFGEDYRATLRGERKFGPLTGVTTFDLVLTSKHILSLEPFTSVYQSVAADVNNSKSVTTFDIVETRKLILGIYDTFPKVPAWRITRPVANPSQVANFAALVDTYQVFLPNLLDDYTFSQLDFVGIKYGDVNGSALFAGPSDDRYNAPPLLLHTAERYLAAGEEYTLQLRWADFVELEGWQLALQWDPNLIVITEVIGLPTEDYNLQKNTLRALWASGIAQGFAAENTLFRVSIKALQATSLSNALFLSPETLRPEAYAVGQSRSPIRLHFGEITEADVQFFAPRPNPSSTQVTFDILLKEPATATLEIFDLNGRRVYRGWYDLAAGMQNLVLLGNEWGNPGVFTYQITLGKTVSKGKLVRI